MLLNRHLTSKNVGMGGALSVFMFVVTGILSLVVFKMNSTKEKD
jgi:multiple sugar transport system permease protein